jgi:tetratricopeptide (TPR) repeat protein
MTASLMIVDDLMRMNLGVYALEVVRVAKQRYPGALDLLLAEASLWNAFGFPDRSLYLLGSRMDRRTLSMRMELLFETGRYRDGERLASAMSVLPPDLSSAKQKIALPPAEIVIKNSWPKPFSEKEIESQIDGLRVLKTRVKSPLLMKLATLEETLLKTGSASIAEWTKAGRNSEERASVLYRLTVLATRRGNAEVARQAALLAVKQLPESPILWRVLIGMSEGDAEIIAEALNRCPSDPEIWLAHIVRSAENDMPKAKMLIEVRSALEKDHFPVETYVRAGDFLLRKGHREAAYACAKAVDGKGTSLLAADMFSLRCALVREDQKLAMSSSLKGVQHALDPSPFYRMVVGLKSAGRMADAELVAALEHLEAQYPDDKRWAEYLGMVYFERKDMVRALNVLSSLIAGDTRGLTARSFVLAAEAARIEGKFGASIDILKKAHALYPDDHKILNNLVYVLAQDPSTLDDAKSMLPELEKIPEKTFHVYDTLATVHMKDGRIREAKQYMDKALKALKKDAYSASEVRVNAAELLFNMGEIKEAEKQIKEIRADSERSDLVDRRASRLLERIEAER